MGLFVRRNGPSSLDTTKKYPISWQALIGLKTIETSLLKIE
jgi:hypothetical protein